MLHLRPHHRLPSGEMVVKRVPIASKKKKSNHVTQKISAIERIIIITQVNGVIATHHVVVQSSKLYVVGLDSYLGARGVPGFIRGRNLCSQSWVGLYCSLSNGAKSTTGTSRC